MLGVYVTTIAERKPFKSRRYQTGEDFVVVDYYAAAEGSVGKWEPDYGDSRPGDTTVPACFGYTCQGIETGLADGKEGSLAVTYLKPKRLDDNQVLSEVRRVPGYGTHGNLCQMRGTRVFICPDAQAEAVVNAQLPAGSLWPGAYGVSAAVSLDLAIERNWRTGLAQIRVYYGVPPAAQFLQQNVGKGIVLIRVGGEPHVLKYDLTAGTALPIEAEDWDDSTKNRYRWVVYKGSNIVLTGTTVLVVRVALRNPNVAALAALVGCYNSGACPKIGGAGAKTLKFLAAPMDLIPGTTDLYMADILLAFNPDGWDTACKAIRENFKVIEHKAYNNDGTTDTNSTDRVGTWVPDTATIADRKVSLPADFAVIDQYVA
jgi:hypothetical protein